MKRLYVLLCCVVAWTGYVKGQGGTPPTIDFKTHLARLKYKMCDSIYRVDTLYYPWEEELQMIELKWKTVWRRDSCKYESMNKSNTYSLMPSIFIFRNKEGAFTKVYNNYLNFNIDSKAFKAIDFVNTDSYKEKYILIEKQDNRYNFYQGLIDKVGNVKLEPIYEELVFFKADSSIRVKEEQLYYFIDCNSLERINNNVFNLIQSTNVEEQYSIVNGYRKYTDSIRNYSRRAIIDNKGNNLFEGNWESIYEEHNLFFLRNINQEHMVIDEKLNTVLPLTKYIPKAVFKYSNNAYKLNNFILEENTYNINEHYKNTVSLIDVNNNTIIPFGKFNSLKPIYNTISKEGNFLVGQFYKEEEKIVPKLKYGIYDEYGVLKIPVTYSAIDIYHNYIHIEEKDKWSIYNFNYEKIIDDVEYIENQDDILNCSIFYTKNKSYILYDLDKPLPKYKILEGNERLYYHDLKADGTIVLENKKTNTYIELKQL